MDRYRDRAILRLRKFRALGIVICFIGPEEVRYLDSIIDNPSSISRDELKQIDERASLFLERASDRLGLKANTSELEELVSIARETPDTMFYVPKEKMDEFIDADSLLRDSITSPPHAKFGFYTEGAPEGSSNEIFELDAALFEDMAIMLNQVLSSNIGKNYESNSLEYKLDFKKERTYVRSGIRSVYAFLEGYLNCLAYDIIKTKEYISESDMSLLIDEDYISIREKVMKYPKIALGKDHPPIQENNCEHFELLISTKEIYRHAVVHPRPHLTVKSIDNYLPREYISKAEEEGRSLPKSVLGNVKESMYLAMGVDDLKRLCDMAIGLVRRIEDELDGRYSAEKMWLVDREDSGGFPNEAFR